MDKRLQKVQILDFKNASTPRRPRTLHELTAPKLIGSLQPYKHKAFSLNTKAIPL